MEGYEKKQPTGSFVVELKPTMWLGGYIGIILLLIVDAILFYLLSIWLYRAQPSFTWSSPTGFLNAKLSWQQLFEIILYFSFVVCSLIFMLEKVLLKIRVYPEGIEYRDLFGWHTVNWRQIEEAKLPPSGFGTLSLRLYNGKEIILNTVDYKNANELIQTLLEKVPNACR